MVDLDSVVSFATLGRGVLGGSSAFRGHSILSPESLSNTCTLASAKSTPIGAPSAAVERLVGLDRHRAAVDPAGDQRVVAHELSRVDLADDLARARLCDFAILGTDAGDRLTRCDTRVFVPKLPAGPENRPSASSPSKKFIGGEPMKPATKRLAGLL